MWSKALEGMNPLQAYKFNEAMKFIINAEFPDDYFELIFESEKEKSLNPSKKEIENWQLEQEYKKLKSSYKREHKKIDKEANTAELTLKNKGLYPSKPIEKTGDKGRFNNFKQELNNNQITYKSLYVVRIQSKINDKKHIKIGITSNTNIEKRFENDDVLELIEVIKNVKLETKTAMALEYFLIRKYRPNDYFAEKEFDEFSRFDGYTEIIPMKHTTELCNDIDAFINDSENISIEFQKLAKRNTYDMDAYLNENKITLEKETIDAAKASIEKRLKREAANKRLAGKVHGRTDIISGGKLLVFESTAAQEAHKAYSNKLSSKFRAQVEEQRKLKQRIGHL
ncbi:hypothetical protein OAI02_06580 [Candidatus Pseudothioglobus singularis]|nr:hypothetical protein [Candidatus Pseudothioglobus singularis]MDB4848142.1 hypothetical protein [Candidatus Pseudothioglobus singularis]